MFIFKHEGNVAFVCYVLVDIYKISRYFVEGHKVSLKTMLFLVL